MKKNNPGCFIAIFILAVLIILFSFAHHHVRHGFNKNITETLPASHPVMVVDFNNNKIINQQELFDGKDAILAVKSVDKKTTTPNDQLIGSISALEQLDANKDGRLDKKDPIFDHLELIFFANGGTSHKNMSLAETKIIAIVFRKGILKEIASLTKSNRYVVGEAITSDGRKLLVKVIPVSIV